MAWSFNRKPFSIAVQSNKELDESGALEQIRKLLLVNGDCIIHTGKKGNKSISFEPSGNIIESAFQVSVSQGRFSAFGVHRITRRFDYSILAIILAMLIWGPLNYAVAALFIYAVFAIYLLGRPQPAIQQALETVAGYEPVVLSNVTNTVGIKVPLEKMAEAKRNEFVAQSELTTTESNQPIMNPAGTPSVAQPVFNQPSSPKKSRTWLYIAGIGAALFFGAHFVIADHVTSKARQQVMWQSMKMKEEGLISTEIEVVDVDVPFDAVFSSSYQIVLHMRSLKNPENRGIAPAMVQGNCWSSGCGVQIPGLLLMGVDR
jgi:hypothetical protein